MDLSATSIRHALVPRRIAARSPIRRDLEEWLRDADLRRHGLPAGAIAIVRQLRVEWAQVAGPDRSTRHDTLGAALGGAVRPALGRGALSGAPAVWFADESELLACLARDAIAGLLSAPWWWTTLLPRGVDRAAAMQYWTASARAVPRAAERLQAMGMGSAWFESWTTSAREDLLTALARHYPLTAAVRCFVEASVTAGAMPRGVPPDSAMRDRSSDEHAGATSRVSPLPRASAPPRRPAPVTSAPARLHQLCLNLARDPACAFDERYVERELLRESPPAADVPRIFGVDSPPNPLAAVDAPTAPAGHAPYAASSSWRSDDAHVVREARQGPTTALPRRVGSTARDVEPDDAVPDTAARETGAAPPNSIPRIDAASGAAVSSPVFDSGTEFGTAHGGLLFVLNAALQLDLYGDASRPLHRGLDMSPWRFLYRTGVAFGGRRFARDPLAAWLESFPGPDEAPVSSDPDAPWRIERDWLRPFDGDQRPLQAVWQSGRLSLVHAAGFAICEAVAAAARCDQVIASELEALGLTDTAIVRVAPSRRGSQSATRAGGSTALARALPYLRARLALALGLRDPRRLAGVLLRVPGQMRVNGDRVDVCFALQRLPIAVRIAGLDRDPGWVPATGRDIRFHFE